MEKLIAGNQGEGLWAATSRLFTFSKVHIVVRSKVETYDDVIALCGANFTVIALGGKEANLCQDCATRFAALRTL